MFPLGDWRVGSGRTLASLGASSVWGPPSSLFCKNPGGPCAHGGGEGLAWTHAALGPHFGQGRSLWDVPPLGGLQCHSGAEVRLWARGEQVCETVLRVLETARGVVSAAGEQLCTLNFELQFFIVITCQFYLRTISLLSLF